MTPPARATSDLRPPDRAANRDLPMLVAATVAIVVAAQLADPGTPIDVVLLAAGGVVLIAQVATGFAPIDVATLAVVVLVLVAVGHQGHVEVGIFLIVLAVLQAAWRLRSTIRALGVAVFSATAIVAVSVARPDSYSWVPWVTAIGFTLSLGRVLHRQRELIAELGRARRSLAEQAVAEERRRIARELHDLAGHTLAAVMLHVTGARHVLRRDLDDAEKALIEAERVGRASLDEIRAAVAALRTTETGTDPTLADGDSIAQLVAEYRRAGIAIDATIAPAISGLPGPAAVALHRIAREALANIARHAPAQQVELTASIEVDGSAHLVVRDRGRRAVGPPAVAGFGLLGMRERARAMGGTVATGPTPDGWLVKASIPAAAHAHRATTMTDGGLDHPKESTWSAS